MLYQAPADIVAGMRAKLQIAGVPFSKAMGLKPAVLRRAAEHQREFDRLVKELAPRPAKKSSEP